MQLVVYAQPNKVVWAQWQLTLVALECFYEAYDTVGMKFAMEFRGKTIGVGVVQNFTVPQSA